MIAKQTPAPMSAQSSQDSRPDGDARRRVLFLLEDFGGGTGNHVCRMVRDWSARGWEVTVVTQTPPLVRLLPDGVDVRVLRRTGWYDRFPLTQMRRLLALWRIVRSVRPDIVHTYFYWSIIYGRVLKLLGVVPVLVENREDMGYSWTPGDYRLLRMTRKIPDRMICVAGAVRDVVLERERADAQRTTVIHNGVELRAAASVGRDEARRQFGFEPHQVVIGMIANLPRTVKGGRRLLDAVRAIVTAVPSARFLLVGQGTDRASLEPELEARGIAPYVYGAGYRRDVDVCYAALDISVLTSSTEGLSITVLESMRCGLPVVVTHVGGNAELVEDGVTGFLVPLEDAGAFVDRVGLLARDASLRRSLGEAGRRRVVEHFAVDDVARRYLDLYEDLLGTQNPHGGRRAALSQTLERYA
jgi:glycosyltransferase involved in cell wall biosynthesis